MHRQKWLALISYEIQTNLNIKKVLVHTCKCQHLNEGILKCDGVIFIPVINFLYGNHAIFL